MALLCSTSLYPDSSLLYSTLLHSTMALQNPTTLYHSSTWLYLTLLHSTTALLSSTGLYLNLVYSTMALIDSTSFYMTLTTLYHACTWRYLILLYYMLPWLHLALLDSTWFYYTLPCLYLSYLLLLNSITLYYGSTSLYWNLLHPTEWVTSLQSLFNSFIVSAWMILWWLQIQIHVVPSCTSTHPHSLHKGLRGPEKVIHMYLQLPGIVPAQLMLYCCLNMLGALLFLSIHQSLHVWLFATS